MAELDYFVNFLNELPDVALKIATEATKVTIDKEKAKLQNFLIYNSGSEKLNNQMIVTKIDDNNSYGYVIDWSNQKVNPSPTRKYVRRKVIKRAKGKRNYSIAPATYHDLAWILNYGTEKKVGNYFITRGVRRLKGLDRRIESQFRKDIAAEIQKRT